MADDKDAKLITITINTNPINVEKRDYSHSEIVQLAVPTAGGSETGYLVKYSKSEKDRDSIVLKSGDLVKMKSGMIFRVTSTGES